MNNRRNFVIGAASICAAAFVPRLAGAQDYPNRPIKLMVGYPAGGAIDLTARLLADNLGKRLGQSLVVDNRAGANGMIGLEAVFRAEPDGYTLALAGASNIAAGPHLVPVRFDPLEMEHVTRLVRAPLTLAVRNDFPAKSLSEFIAYAKANEVTFGSAGVGSSHHLTGELFRLRTGTKLLHVPYKGSGPMLNDLMAGTIDASFGDPTLVKLGKGGKARVLAASSDGQWRLNPDVPPMSPTVQGFVAENWYSLAAPPRTPKPLLEMLHRQTLIAMNDAQARKTFEDQGLEVSIMDTPAFKEYVKKDSALWASVIKQANIKI